MGSSNNDNNIVFNDPPATGPSEGYYVGWGGLNNTGESVDARVYQRAPAGAPVHAAPDGSITLSLDGIYARVGGAWVLALSFDQGGLTAQGTATVTAQTLIINDFNVQAGDLVTALLFSDDTGGALGPIVTGVCGAGTITLDFTNAPTNSDGVVQYQVSRP